MRIKWTSPESTCIFSRSCGMDPCPVANDLPCEEYKMREPKTVRAQHTNNETRG